MNLISDMQRREDQMVTLARQNIMENVVENDDIDDVDVMQTVGDLLINERIRRKRSNTRRRQIEITPQNNLYYKVYADDEFEVYDLEPDYEERGPLIDATPILTAIDSKFDLKIQEMAEVSNSVLETWLEILSKKRKVLLELWKKKFFTKDDTEGILYYETVKPQYLKVNSHPYPYAPPYHPPASRREKIKF